MTVWITKGRVGGDVLHIDSREFGCERRPKVLLADDILIRVSTGHVFTAPPEVPLRRLSVPQVEMVKHFLDERGMPKINLFSGEPPREAKKPHCD